MKTLKNHLILYDAECPMCNLYTHAFTTTGMLDTDGRAPYQEMPEFACPIVDRQRAVNEIALIDRSTGEVRYGIDSLFAIMANSFPGCRPVFACKTFRWAMRKLYAFISYNRKVIIPAPKGPTHAFQPSFRLRYRLAWILFTWLATGCVLTAYARLLSGLLPTGNPWREWAMGGGQILFQGAIISAIAPAKRWEYLGNLMTISLAGALLLLPMLAMAAFTRVLPLVAAGYFLLVATAMVFEHIRRSKLLQLGWGLTISWGLYWLLLLFVIR